MKRGMWAYCSIMSRYSFASASFWRQTSPHQIGASRSPFSSNYKKFLSTNAILVPLPKTWYNWSINTINTMKIQNSLLVKKLITIFSDRARIIGLGSEKEIFLTELKMFPPFLRFENVRLLYWWDSLSIEERCEWFENQLVPLWNENL